MRLPIDVSGLAFTLVGVQPVRDFETKQVKGDKDGVPLFAVRVFCLAAAQGEGEVIKVTVAGEPSGLVPGGAVAVRELTAQPYSVGDKHGVAFRAAAVQAAQPAANGRAGSSS